MFRISSLRRSAALLIAVFVVSVGVGALVIVLVLTRDGHKHVVVKRVLTVARATAPDHTARLAPEPRRRRRTSAPASQTLTVPLGAPASFAALERQLGGPIGLAVGPLGAGPVQTLGGFQAGHAWSTMKVPVLVTLLSDYAKSNRGLTPEGSAYAARALEQSDNAAAEALFGELERIHGGLLPASSAVQQTLAAAGDQSTVINTAPNNQGFTTWGQSIWSSSGEVAFFRALARGCMLSPHDTAYVLGLMRNVTSSQRWGVGQAGFPSETTLAFKAGWGPEGGGYLVRQTAIVGIGSHGYVLSMIARGSSFSDGVNLINSMADWARQHLALDASGPSARCGGMP